MPSLALLLHLVEVVGGHAGDTDVSLDAARLAAAWCDFLEAHARRAYAAALQGDLHSAHALAQHIKRGDVGDGDPVRAIYRRQWSLLRTPEEVGSALALLERHDWLRVETTHTSGRPSEVVRLNPHLTGGQK